MHVLFLNNMTDTNTHTHTRLHTCTVCPSITRPHCVQERADARMAAFRDACGQILAGNGQNAANEAGKTLREYLLNIVMEPRSRSYRMIPKDNVIYKEKVSVFEAKMRFWTVAECSSFVYLIFCV